MPKSNASRMLLFLSIILLNLIQGVLCSAGDNAWIFIRCYSFCTRTNCSSKTEIYKIPIHLKLTGWDCRSECDYECMWKTVEAFQKDGSPIPQFHGKWPFVRVLGMQEPASVIFSILNGLAVLKMVIKFWKVVPSTAPMYMTYQTYGIICINAWFWSAVFHTRDTPFTEKMDYFCALSLVQSCFYALCLRLIGTDTLWKPLLVGLIHLLFFLNHVHYLGFVKFDYGYNMKVTLGVGLVNFFGWLFWSIPRWKTHSYVKQCVGSLVMLNALILLEIKDFPPLLWVTDAHSLWHLGTIPVPLIWFSFCIEDCLELNRQKVDKKVDGKPEIKIE